jgi:hypothetical protein
MLISMPLSGCRCPGIPLIEPDHTIFARTDREESGVRPNPHLQMTQGAQLKFHAAVVRDRVGGSLQRPAPRIGRRESLRSQFFLSATTSSV